jgi:hypothetical protein
MSAILNKMSEFFCPPDRELALRGQIKTGWSTVAARRKSRPSQMKLPLQEIQHIQAVVAHAEALQMAEEIRIGVQMLKLQQLRKSCRGNGTSTCILCGYDLVHHRSRSLSSIHVCFECAQAVCSRCKAEYKCHTGETVVLCRLCSDERELWKKSGAWLNNKLPVIHVSEEELEKAQQQRQMTMKVMPLRTDLIVPASHLDEDDDELEDDLSTVSGSTTNYGGFSSFFANSAPSSRSPSPPDMSFMATEPNAAAAAWKGERQCSAELHPQSHMTLPYAKSPTGMRKSGSYDLVAIRHRQRSSTMPHKERSTSITRKPAMGGERKERMEELRRRVIEKKRAADLQKSGGAIQRTPSPTLGLDPLRMTRSHSNDLPVVSPRFPPVPGSTSPHPHIKVVVSTPPTSPDMHRGGEQPRSGSPLTGATVAARDSTPKSHESDFTRASATSHSPHTDVFSSVDGKKRKPVASPRKKQGTTEPETPHSGQQYHQGRSQDDGEMSLVAEGRRFATIEREKPSAAPRKRAGSVDKDKGREYKSETLDRKRRTPDPQPSSEFRTVNLSSKRTPPVTVAGESKSGYSPVFPAEVSSELRSSVGARGKRGSREEVTFTHHQEEHSNPSLKDIGKRVSITSEGSVDSQQGGEGVSRADSGSSGEHTWKRQGARRTARSKHTTRPTVELDEEDQGPRGRLRSGALSEGGRAARRTHSGEDGEGSHSRTRSGALSGSDAQAFRRGRSPRGSPRPRGGAGVETDGRFPEPLEQFGVVEAESIRRARAGDRRAGRTGGDLLVATDGEQQD